jgi:replicative DNA helicase
MSEFANVAWERAFVGGMLQAKPQLFATFLGEADPDLLTDPQLHGILAACRAEYGERGTHDLGFVYLRCLRDGVPLHGETFDQLMQEFHGGDAPLTGYLEVLRDARKQRAARAVRETPAAITGQASLDAIDLALAKVPPSGAVVGHNAGRAVRDWLRGLEAQEAPTALATGIGLLDQKLGGGFSPGSLVIVGARTSQGKSVMALRLARGIVEQAQRPVLFHALEMGERELVGRLVADRAGLENYRVQKAGAAQWSQSEHGRIANAVGAIHHLPLTFRTQDAVWPDHLAAYARWRAEHPDAAALVVDYVGLIRGVQAEKRYQELGMIAHGLKQFAVATGLVVIAVSQLNRSAGAGDDPPALHQLRESGDLEQDADCVMLLHLPERHGGDPTPMDVDVAKQRHGACGAVRLWFDRRYCRIEDAMVDENGVTA